MSSPLQLRQHISRIGAPILVVGMLYLLTCHLPASRVLSQRLAKQDKLAELVRQRSADPETSVERLSALQAEELSLGEAVEAAKQTGARLVTQRDDCTAELLASTSPAASLSQVLQLFDRHHLECLGSTPVVPSAKAQGQSHELLKSVADMLGQREGFENQRREVRLTLHGTFEDMRSALHELPTAGACVVLVSVQMEVTSDEKGSHVWTVTILV